MADLTTTLIHHSYVPPEGFAAPQPGVFKASTVIFPNVAAMRNFEWKDKSAYTYGLHGTPTTYMLEERLCTLEGGLQCLLVSSGLAAIANVALSLLKTGDEVLIPDNAYGPNKVLAAGELKAWGITHRFYDPLSPQDLAAKISDKTRLVWLEAPGSVTLEFPDLCEQVRLCKAHGVVTALDNTWGAGLAFAPFDLVPGVSSALGVDISVHALTKYMNGHGNSIGGIIVDSGKFPWAEHKARFKRLNEPDVSYHGVVYTEALGAAAYIGRARVVPLRNMGAALSPMNAFLILQGIETLALRMDRICDNTLKIAGYLKRHSKVGWVNYAGLSDHPDHALVKKTMGGRASESGLAMCIHRKSGARITETTLR